MQPGSANTREARLPAEPRPAQGASHGTCANVVRSALAIAASPIAPFRIPILVTPTCALDSDVGAVRW